MGKILITGADGFIGSHQTEALVRQGYNVRSFIQYVIFIGDPMKLIADALSVGSDVILTSSVCLRRKAKLCASNDKPGCPLGWRLSYGSFDGFHRGIAKTEAWFRETSNLATYKSDINSL